jgi:hypothetical protein
MRINIKTLMCILIAAPMLSAQEATTVGLGPPDSAFPAGSPMYGLSIYFRHDQSNSIRMGFMPYLLKPIPSTGPRTRASRARPRLAPRLQITSTNCWIEGAAAGDGGAADTQGYWLLGTPCPSDSQPRLNLDDASSGLFFVSPGMPMQFCYSSERDCQGDVYLFGVYDPRTFQQLPSSSDSVYYGQFELEGEVGALECYDGILIKRGTFQSPMQMLVYVETDVWLGDFDGILWARSPGGWITQGVFGGHNQAVK